MNGPQPAGTLRGRPLGQRTEEERETLAEVLAARLAGPVSLLGLVFLVVLLGDLLAPVGSPLRPLLTVATWVIWSVFVLDFVVRMIVAPSVARFLKRNWWQIIFLLVPFLRFLALLRVSRGARALASAVRAGRSAGQRLSVRLGWLLMITIIVVLGSGEILVSFAGYAQLSAALHDTAMATIVGEPIGSDAGIVQVLDVVLGAYSVVVFATLAGALGAFFLERHQRSIART